MKKIVLLLLALALVISLISCGSSNNAGEESVDSSDPENTVEADTKKEEKGFKFGSVDANSYYSIFADYGIKLDDDWTFYSDDQIKELNGLTDLSEEDVKKKVNNATIIIDMLAINKNSDNISFMFEKADSVTIKYTELDKILDNALGGALSSFENANVTDIVNSKETIQLLDREFGVLRVSGNILNASSETVKVYQTQLFVKCDGYIGCIGITTYGEDRSEELISLLFKAEAIEETSQETEAEPQSEVAGTDTTPEVTETEPSVQETIELETMNSDLEHSDYYIPEIDVDAIATYFNEVVLDAEYSDSTSKNLVQKWVAPIYYKITGQSTEEDRIVFNKFCTFLNSIDGFPGIYEATDNNCNLRIMFGTVEEIIAVKGEEFRGNDGYITFWYNNVNELYDAEIFYSNEVDQYIRNSVIIEELYNGMGPVQDTSLRSDSIIYSEYTAPQELTRVDEVILKLLYHPDIKCGMNADECYEVIKKLYY